MEQNEYQIKSKNITNYSEETSSISNISYEIENANNNGLPRNKIMTQTEKLKDDNKFPSNLEYVDSYTDPNTGTTSTVFLNKDTGKVTVGMAGTNVHGDQLKNTLNPFNFIKDKQEAIDARGSMLDFVADANIGLRTVTDKDTHFKNTQQFIKNLKKDYDIDTITGHSLGGRDAILMGVSNDIDNIVVYNPAPLTVKDIRYFIKSQSSSVSDIEKDGYVNKLLESYDGNILRIVSENDELDGVIKKTIYSSAGDEMIIKNGKGHSILGFLGKREQREIKAELEKLKGYQDANNKSFIAAKKQATNKLKQIDAVKASMIQASGGALSSSQQKVLEFLTVLSVVESLSQMVEEEMQQLRKMYADMKKRFEKNWEDAQESGREMGKHLSSGEVLDALNAGNVNENKLVTKPLNKISNRLTQLKNVASQYKEYVTKVKTSINEIVAKDQSLASQIGDLA
ncbi:hypothetical protein BUZ15_08715 [Staphylococcus gallinarum]|uniref:hypothetical protein n=1 Tax=Staphylococcus TaxID=1279 RepID=UPI000D1F19CC|nr:hypothetical protein [Staphylococcus gallinarum]MCD8820522.1 hypothetical protein [Staphylococcus gallinarum]PTK91068.1 hypothetical protein BUZ03_06620 [Staphylococcus gallinarum]PTL09527.1 hypothetical protein BUZ09_04915 [Staphylococcus gallinarum]PTL09864.1 hypothetical protein BUZ15_08715 [Staphylococcus gallinarum]RIO74966.1 hypothetical protein BUZ12_12185 [Staphylococcus gallinarum]